MKYQEIAQVFADVAGGKLDKVQKYLKDGGDPNVRLPGFGKEGQYSVPLVVHAAVYGQAMIVGMLRDKGADMNAVTDPTNPRTAYEILPEGIANAAKAAVVTAAKAVAAAAAEVIAAKAAARMAEVRVEESAGRKLGERLIPLFEAAGKGDIGAVQAYLTGGGNPSIRASHKSIDHSMPLVIHAAASGQKAVVELLRTAGADMDATSTPTSPTADQLLTRAPHAVSSRSASPKKEAVARDSSAVAANRAAGGPGK